MLRSTDRLLIFTRYPQPGKTKTRLIPALGAEGAAALQCQLTEHTIRQVRQLAPLSTEIWFAADDSGDPAPMQNWLGPDWLYQAQPAGDLGDRLTHAFQLAFESGMERVVAVGTDCPGLDAARMMEAFQALQFHDLTLGRATDGGYYLIGLRRMIPELFAGIDWGTERVFGQTIAIAQQLGLTAATLAPLTDIDRPEDLPVWEAIRPSPKISLILPVLNEANSIQAVLQSISRPQVEVIVVDGGSQDQTIALAQAAGVTVISAAPGRASQMNAGAAIAIGQILLFLHADTRLPDNFEALVVQTLASGAIAGAFELRIDDETPGLRWVEWGVRWRSRWLQMPYGDQAIFLKAETFRTLGGFPDLPIMEDFEFVRRLQKLGGVAIAPAAVLTSGRRWQKLGLIKTTLLNQLIVTAYLFKVSPDRLARWYRGQ